MSRIVIFESLTLDGVYQAPAGADEDPRDGFVHGGWAIAYSDEVAGRAAAESMSTTGAILLGRRTYQHFATVARQFDPDSIRQILHLHLKGQAHCRQDVFHEAGDPLLHVHHSRSFA